jgi:hypothetical protein
LKRALFALLLVTASTAPAEARPPALYPGLRIGGALRTRDAGPPAAFRVGATFDWATSFGLASSFRIDVDDRIETATSIGVGWYGEGVFDVRRGLPVGAFVGPLYGFDREGTHRVGGRLHVLWSLWVNRATIDLDVDVLHGVRSGGRMADDGVEVVVGIALRIVPVGPWKL